MHDVTNETTLHQQLTQDMFIQQTKQLAQNTKHTILTVVQTMVSSLSDCHSKGTPKLSFQ